jgi:hypothetical protein
MGTKKTKEPMRFSQKIIIVMFATMILFTMTMIVTFWKYQAVPDSLIEPFFGFFGIEGGALGIIKVAETIADKFELKKNGGKKK